MNELTARRVAEYLRARLAENAPVREKPLGPIPGSPFPGNLKQNGIEIAEVSPQKYRVAIGNDGVLYAVYTEKTSHRPGWIQKSVTQTVNMVLRTYGGKRT